MSNLHRIRWIDSRIRGGNHPNCSDIAHNFEISARQASRDIEYMRYSLGAPIEYSQEENGYYYTDSAFELPSLYITDEEKQTLSYLAYKYREAGSEHAVRIAGLFSRLTGDDLISKGEAAIVPVYGMQRLEAAVFGRLRKAAADLEKVDMEYINARSEISRRIFCPYKLFTAMQATYVAGFCELRQEIRVFRLSRIRGVTGTGSHFEILPSFRPEEYADETAIKRMEAYVARVRFASPPDMGAYKVKLISVKDSVYELSFTESGEMLSMLLAQRSNFTLMHPGWLKEKLLKRVQSILNNNS